LFYLLQTVYIGGYFDYIEDINGATGTRNFFAAFDVNTAQLLPLNANIVGSNVDSRM
jgi:hypothetical protein